MSTTLYFAILLFHLVFCGFWLNDNPFYTRVASAQDKTPHQSEGGAYKAWYDARSRKDSALANYRAKRFLEQYPNSSYADVIRKYLTGTSSEIELSEDQDLLPLIDALSLGDTRQALALIEKGKDVNIRRKNGQTALMIASEYGQTETVKALIERGVDLNAKETRHGWTAIVYAVWSGNADTVIVLLDNGANINGTDKEGATLLQQAIMSRHPKVIKIVREAMTRQ